MNKSKLELMFIISNRGLADKVIEVVKDKATFPSILRCRGTATSDVLAALGIGEPEKDLIWLFCETKNVNAIYGALSDELEFTQKRLGIALTVPLSAVGGNLTLQILLGKTKDLM